MRVVLSLRGCPHREVPLSEVMGLLASIESGSALWHGMMLSPVGEAGQGKYLCIGRWLAAGDHVSGWLVELGDIEAGTFALVTDPRDDTPVLRGTWDGEAFPVRANCVVPLERVRDVLVNFSGRFDCPAGCYWRSVTWAFPATNKTAAPEPIP